MQEAHIHTLSRAKVISPSIVCTSFVNSIIYLQKQCGPISNLKTPIICGTVLKCWRSKKIIEIPAFMRRLSSPYICFFFCINFSSSDPFWSVHCDPILGASNRQGRVAKRAPKKRARFGAQKGFQTSLVALFLVCEQKEKAIPVYRI